MLYLKVHGDRIKFVVSCFRVTNQIVPAAEHLPTEIESIVIATSIITNIFGHPGKSSSLMQQPGKSKKGRQGEGQNGSHGYTENTMSGKHF